MLKFSRIVIIEKHPGNTKSEQRSADNVCI